MKKIVFLFLLASWQLHADSLIENLEALKTSLQELLHSLRSEPIIETEEQIPVVTGDGHQMKIPHKLVNELQTLKYMISDLGPEEAGEAIPLPNVTQATLQHLIQFYEGTLDVSTLSIIDALNLLNTADYLDYKDQNRIAGSIIDVLSTPENRIAFLMGNLDLSMLTAFTLQAELIQRIQPCMEQREPKTLEGHTSWILSVAISPDGNYIVTGSEDGTAKVWDSTIGELLRTLGGHTGQIYSVAISPDGNYIVTGSSDRTAKIWDRKTGEVIKTLKGHTGTIWSVAISPDGKYIVTGSFDKTAKVWDSKTGKVIKTLKGHTGRIYSVAISPDGNYIVTGSEDNTAKIWDSKTGKVIRTLKGHTGRIYSVAISPDGNNIVTSSEYYNAKIWDSKTGELIKTLKGQRRLICPSVGITEGHISWVRSVAFSPDGNYIVTGSDDNKAKIWDSKTGKVIKTLKGHTRAIKSVAISPDNRYIVTGSIDKTAKVWPLGDEELNNDLVNSSLEQVLLSYFACFYSEDVKKYQSTEYVQNLIKTSAESVQHFINSLLSK